MPKSLFFEIAPAPGKASGLVDSSRANAVERGVSLTVGACRRDAAGGLPPQPTEPVKQWARSNPRCIRLRKETHGLEPEKNTTNIVFQRVHLQVPCPTLYMYPTYMPPQKDPQSTTPGRFEGSPTW